MVPGFVVLALASTISAETGYQDSGIFSLDTANVSAVQELDFIPGQVNQLSLCYPNPFNPRTTIEYQLAQGGKVHLAVYDLKGRLVKSLVSGEVFPPGNHSAVWKGQDNAGHQVAGGVYLYRLKVNNFTAIERMTPVK